MHTADERLRRDRDRFVAFAFSTAHLLLEIRPDGTITYAAGAACGLAPHTDALVGGNVLDLCTAAEREYVENLLRRFVKRVTTDLVRVSLRTLNASTTEFLLGGQTIDGIPDRIHLGLILAPSAVQQRPLGANGLHTRESFAAVAQAHLDVSGRTGLDEGLTLLVVEGLSRLATRHGPEAVGPVARRIGSYLRSISAGGDAVGDLGTGKFGLIRAPGVSEPDVKTRIAEILAEESVEGRPQSISLSFATPGLSEADAARALAYSIRRFVDSGPRDFSIRSLQDGASALLSEASKLVVQARQVLDERKVEVVYQPIIQMDNGEAHHLEALARISGVSSIGDWMRFTEESGLANDFDLVMTGKVLETLEEHAKAGWRPPVAINLSAKSLGSGLFLEQFFRVVDAAPASARQLLVEITETASIADFDQMTKVVSALRDRGFKICLDDVGSGTTSFQTLRALQCDYVKLDGALVRNAAHDRRDRAALQAAARLALDLGAELIAEQIETREQANAMRAIGCRFGQGYLFGRPTADVRLHRDRFQIAEIVDPQWTAIQAPPPPPPAGRRRT
ncbi:EAL domain-containing protein [Arenibaculum pallidiluteum]|uniref:EAL domain-containing protein n=1 Tax=Arenibaculum pallidiluteum TaxID=2812559 RepID=UPI001A96DF4A|nr:EAL domain-containing protein [Arenibaculum pallidiluteum]